MIIDLYQSLDLDGKVMLNEILGTVREDRMTITRILTYYGPEGHIYKTLSRGAVPANGQITKGDLQIFSEIRNGREDGNDKMQMVW